MADGRKRFLSWTTLSVEILISCCSNLLCGHGLDIFAHVLPDTRWETLEDMFSKQMVDLDVLDVFLELEKKL